MRWDRGNLDNWMICWGFKLASFCLNNWFLSGIGLPKISLKILIFDNEKTCKKWHFISFCPTLACTIPSQYIAGWPWSIYGMIHTDGWGLLIVLYPPGTSLAAARCANLYSTTPSVLHWACCLLCFSSCFTHSAPLIFWLHENLLHYELWISAKLCHYFCWYGAHQCGARSNGFNLSL